MQEFFAVVKLNPRFLDLYDFSAHPKKKTSFPLQIFTIFGSHVAGYATK